MVPRVSKSQAYMEMAIALSKRSTCLDKQVGCIITNRRNEVIASGYNGSPRGELHCLDRGYCIKDALHDPNKCPSAHAEQNALLQCRVPDEIHTIYITLSPCVSCIRIIMNTPCERIVFLHEHRHHFARDMWTNKERRWEQYEL